MCLGGGGSGPAGGAPCGCALGGRGPERWGCPKFRAFFSLSRHNFLYFFSLSWGSFRAPAFKNTTKIQRKDSQEREERKKIVAGEGKKSEILGCPVEGRRSGPAEGGPGGGGPGVGP